MDILELIARTEWPVVVGGALFFFRRPLVALVSGLNLKKVEGLGFKAEFEKGLEKVDNLTPPSAEELKQIAIDREAKGENVTQSFKISSWTSHLPEPSPESVVLGAWTSLEANMRAMIDAIHPSTVGRLSVPIRRLQEAAYEFGLTDDEVESLKTLRDLRNRVAHNHSGESILNWEDAMRFKAEPLNG